MNGKAFTDTNILVYAFSQSEKDKQQAATELLDNCSPIISTQVIREFIHVAVIKHKQPIDKIMAKIENFASTLTIVNEDLEMIKQAVKICQRYKYRFYDSLIIAAALKSNCSILYSEDLQSGQTIENTLAIINPFTKN